MILEQLAEQAAKTGDSIGFVVLMRPDGVSSQTVFQLAVSELNTPKAQALLAQAFATVRAEVQGQEPPVELPPPDPEPDATPEALILSALQHPEASDLAPGRLGHAIAAVRFALAKPIRGGAPDLPARLETLKTLIVQAKEARVG